MLVAGSFKKDPVGRFYQSTFAAAPVADFIPLGRGKMIIFHLLALPTAIPNKPENIPVRRLVASGSSLGVKIIDMPRITTARITMFLSSKKKSFIQIALSKKFPLPADLPGYVLPVPLPL